jgi:hypothetical protein
MKQNITGLGIFVWQRRDWQNIISTCKSAGIKWICVKMADTSRYAYFTDQVVQDLLTLCHENGILLGAWNYSLPSTWQAQVATIKSFFTNPNATLDFWCIDAEEEWAEAPGNDQTALQFLSSLRQEIGDAFLAHCPFSVIEWHYTFPYTSFNTYCDVVCDQLYWTEFGTSVQNAIQISDASWKKYFGYHPELKLPRCPIGPTYGSNNYPHVKGPITAADMEVFLDHYSNLPLLSLYSFDACAPEIWQLLQSRAQPKPVDTNTQPAAQTQQPGLMSRLVKSVSRSTK